MKKRIFVSFSIIVAAEIIFAAFVAVGQALENYTYLPLIIKQATPTPTNTHTPTPTPSSTSTPTPTPTPTATTQPTTGTVLITFIYYDGAGSTEPDEYVEIKNADSHSIQLQSWTLRDNQAHVYTFPSFVIQPNQYCRVYTNQSHPETCGFNYGSGSPIWNNTGDCAWLKNAQGADVHSYCYP